MSKSEFACEPPALKTLMKSNATGEKRTIWRTELTATRTAQSVGQATQMSVMSSSGVSFKYHSTVPLVNSRTERIERLVGGRSNDRKGGLTVYVAVSDVGPDENLCVRIRRGSFVRY